MIFGPLIKQYDLNILSPTCSNINAKISADNFVFIINNQFDIQLYPIDLFCFIIFLFICYFYYCYFQNFKLFKNSLQKLQHIIGQFYIRFSVFNLLLYIVIFQICDFTLILPETFLYPAFLKQSFSMTTPAFVITFFIFLPFILGGYGNLILPRLVQVPYLCFPRLNFIGLHILCTSFILFFTAMICSNSSVIIFTYEVTSYFLLLISLIFLSGNIIICAINNFCTIKIGQKNQQIKPFYLLFQMLLLFIPIFIASIVSQITNNLIVAPITKINLYIYEFIFISGNILYYLGIICVCIILFQLFIVIILKRLFSQLINYQFFLTFIKQYYLVDQNISQKIQLLHSQCIKFLQQGIFSILFYYVLPFINEFITYFVNTALCQPKTPLGIETDFFLKHANSTFLNNIILQDVSLRAGAGLITSFLIYSIYESKGIIVSPEVVGAVTIRLVQLNADLLNAAQINFYKHEQEISTAAKSKIVEKLTLIAETNKFFEEYVEELTLHSFEQRENTNLELHKITILEQIANIEFTQNSQPKIFTKDIIIGQSANLFNQFKFQEQEQIAAGQIKMINNLEECKINSLIPPNLSEHSIIIEIPIAHTVSNSQANNPMVALAVPLPDIHVEVPNISSIAQAIPNLQADNPMALATPVSDIHVEVPSISPEALRVSPEINNLAIPNAGSPEKNLVQSQNLTPRFNEVPTITNPLPNNTPGDNLLISSALSNIPETTTSLYTTATIVIGDPVIILTGLTLAATYVAVTAFIGYILEK